MAYAKRISLGLMAAALLLSTGCAQDVNRGQPQAEQSFAYMSPIRLAVTDVPVQFAPQAFVQKVPDSFVVPLDQMVSNYFKSRFQAVGGMTSMGALVVTIEDVNIAYAKTPSDYSVGRLMDMGGYDTYTVALSLRLENRLSDGSIPYGNTVRAQRQISIPEHFSIAEREASQRHEMERMIADIDQRIVAIVVNEMALAAGGSR